jgi:hypothetical protein
MTRSDRVALWNGALSWYAISMRNTVLVQLPSNQFAVVPKMCV